MVFAMRTSSTLRSLALVVVCMASLSAHAQSGRWWEQRVAQAGLPAGPMSPQAWQIGLGPYQLYDIKTGSYTKLDKATGRFTVRPNLLGGYSPLIPANQLLTSPTNSSASSILRVPASVPVPGKSSSVPVEIIQPVGKGTMARILTKSLKVLPVVGTAYQLGELLEEAGMLFRDGEFWDKQQSGAGDGQIQVSEGLEWIINNPPGVFVGYTPEAACRAFVSAAGFVYHSSNRVTNYGVCRFTRSGDPYVLHVNIRMANSSSCPAGYYITPNGCVPNRPVVQPIDELEAASRIGNASSDQSLIDAVNSLPNDPRVIDVIAREIQDESDRPWFRWPSPLGFPAPTTITINDPYVTTTTNTDGSTVTHTKTTTATISGDTITFNTTTVTNTYNQSGQLTGTTTTTTTLTDPRNPNSPQQEDLECGLPDTPPCKIDESGTPDPPVNDAEQIVRGLFAQWQTCVDDIGSCLPQLPDISWTFALPSGCSPIPLPGFERWGLSSVDICPYQSMIHNIMSMLWAAAGLFGAISIISRRRTSE